MAADEKRDTERMSILGELAGEIMRFEPMLIREIGRGGVTIETRFPLHLNSLHDVRLMLGGRPVVVKGRVVHSRICDVDQELVSYSTGMEFVEPAEHVIEAIVEFLQTVQADRAGV